MIAAFFARFWPYLAGAALLVSFWFGIQVLNGKLDAAKAQRDKAMVQLQISNQSIAQLQSDIDKQNAAIANLDAEGEKRLEEGRALILAEVRKGARASELAAQLAAKPQQGGDQSKTSAVVLQAKDLL